MKPVAIAFILMLCFILPARQIQHTAPPPNYAQITSFTNNTPAIIYTSDIHAGSKDIAAAGDSDELFWKIVNCVLLIQIVLVFIGAMLHVAAFISTV